MLEVFGTDTYYEAPGEGYSRKRERGNIYEALVPYSGEEKPQRLKVVAAGGGEPPWCEVEEVTLNDIRNAPAVEELGLAQREALIVRKAKCRRVVLLSCPPANWQSSGTRSENVYLVAPIYSFRAQDGDDHRSRVKAYAYNTLFWLPGDDNFGMREGCVRLDRVQPVNAALLESKPIKLIHPASDALIAWYGAYLTNRIPQRIGEYRTAALAELRP
jgi:hypothetical protein